MNDFRIPLGSWVDVFVEWLTSSFKGFFDVLRTIIRTMYDTLDFALSSPPFWVIIILIAAIAWYAKGWKLALGSTVGLLVIVGVNQWDNAMDSLALVLLAAVFALLLAIPLGILAARNDTASKIIRPILDFLQTMPAFVYLIPALMLFRLGVVPGIVATVVFALAPGVRLTELGIRGVDREVVEAGYAFGATPRRILRQIQLPLAMPSIMAGINQVIMLSLSMVVIAGMVGAGGLGGDVVKSLNSIDVGLGVEAGLSVVILAMILDRVTGALGTPKPQSKLNRASQGASKGSTSRKVLTGAVAIVAVGTLAFSLSAVNNNSNSSKGTINIGLFNWDEAIAVSHLWKHVLEEEGYDVNLTEADPGAVFLGLADGDFDLVLDVWLPNTHAEYLKQYGDDIVELGAWNNEAKLAIAVNKDAPVDSLEDLAKSADKFDNQIVGIEPGAGLTKLTTEEVIPSYGLQKMEYTTSSTPAMLAELKAATKDDENIVVTLWQPHWAYDEFPLKNLEDPKGTLGDAETLNSYGSKTFESDFPEVATWMNNFKMDSENLNSLENAMFNENDDTSKYDEVIAKWLADHKDYADSLTD